MAPTSLLLPARAMQRYPSEPIMSAQSHTPKHVEAAIALAAELAEGSPQASPLKRNCYKLYQSPMAAYFGDDALIGMDVPLGNSPFGSRTPLADKSSQVGFANVVADSCHQGLPFKSPMSAYFDGDCNVFNLAVSPEANFTPSPLLTSSSDSSDSDSTSAVFGPSFSLMQMVPMPPCSGQQTPARSALRRSPSRSARRVTWADDSEKAEIRLTELLDIPCIDSCGPVIQGRVWELSQDAQGCRDVQDAINSEALPRACALVAELRGHVNEAAQCPHANHVLRKVITTMPAPAFDFILEELLSQGANHITEIARHRFGCRIIECLLVNGAPNQVTLISECLLQDGIALCSHMYANFVMQRMFDHAPVAHRNILMQLLQLNLKSVGVNFFGSAVLGKALQNGACSDRRTLALAITSMPGLLAAIAKYKHGKTVVTSIFETLTGDEREMAVLQLSATPLKVPKGSRSCQGC